jgi:hypothetical protein
MTKKKQWVKQKTTEQSVELKVAEETALASTESEEKGSPSPDWSKIERMDENSLKARWKLEKWSVIRELWRSHLQMVTFYMTPQGGNHSMDEAINMASSELGEGTLLNEEMERIANMQVTSLSWYTLEQVFLTKPSYAQEIWEEVKQQALMDFKSGHFAAELFERTDWQKDVWKRAHFVVVFDEMAKEYNPRGAIEHSMVEMVAVNYFLWRHWVGEHLHRATTEPRRESYDYQEWVRRNSEVTDYYDKSKISRKRERHWTDGYWDIPYQHEAESIQHALDMADRCRRAYHASVRALRDWRRYSVPVTINNPQQVNIAADGGQQVNALKSEK